MNPLDEGDGKSPLERAVSAARDGAIGVELSLWCGFGLHRDLFFVYVRLGIVTLYLTSRRLHRFIGRCATVLALAQGGRG